METDNKLIIFSYITRTNNEYELTFGLGGIFFQSVTTQKRVLN